jgi:hypothetical protein
MLENTRTTELIKQIINPTWQVFVLDGNLIQSMIIYAHLLSTILLRDKNHRAPQRGELGGCNPPLAIP